VLVLVLVLGVLVHSAGANFLKVLVLSAWCCSAEVLVAVL
jgi:hypothetical protein